MKGPPLSFANNIAQVLEQHAWLRLLVVYVYTHVALSRIGRHTECSLDCWHAITCIKEAFPRADELSREVNNVIVAGEAL